MNQPSCAWNLSDLAKVQPNGLTVMSTFACGGGSSMGYKLAGCDVLAANDIDPEMAWHYKRNLLPKHYFLCPIKDLLTADLPIELFNLDILDGSPPCSTFSLAGSREKSWGKKKHFREGQAEQVLSDLFFDYLDLVGRLRPRVAIAENVKGMILGNARGYTKLVMARFAELGYRAQLFLVNAADCGVPQQRERVFFVALREDIQKPRLSFSPACRWVSVREACAGLPPLTQEEIEHTKPAPNDARWWPKTRPGEDYSAAVMRAGLKQKLWNFKKLDPSKPSFTLPSANVLRHWSEMRSLTFSETRRIGSFPDDYHATSQEIGKYMVGMSVPPRMAEAVARAVIGQWLRPSEGRQHR